MPIPDTSCENCSPTCNSLFDVVGSIVTVAYEAVACQLTPALCENFTGFVSHAEPNHPDADYVAGWIAGIGIRDQNQNTPAGLMLPIPVVEVGVKLAETGYPTVGGDGFPSYAELNNAAMHSFSHAEAMAKAIFANIGKGSRDRILRDCGWMGMSRIIPARPSGGIVSWTFSVSVQAPGW
jgi:hypothetical protein